MEAWEEFVPRLYHFVDRVLGMPVINLVIAGGFAFWARSHGLPWLYVVLIFLGSFIAIVVLSNQAPLLFHKVLIKPSYFRALVRTWLDRHGFSVRPVRNPSAVFQFDAADPQGRGASIYVEKSEPDWLLIATKRVFEGEERETLADLIGRVPDLPYRVNVEMIRLGVEMASKLPERVIVMYRLQISETLTEAEFLRAFVRVRAAMEAVGQTIEGVKVSVERAAKG